MPNKTFHDCWSFRVSLEVSQPGEDRTYEFEVQTAGAVQPDEALDEALGMAAEEELITHAVASIKQVERD